MRVIDTIGGTLVRLAERYLNYLRARKRRRRAARSRNQIVEWVKSFLWAAGMVLLINQYVLQAYQIPSGSMRNTLVEGDRIFVGKFVFGPELLPGAVKLRGPRRPQYGDVVIFENPTYISRGTLYAILQRVIYMVTLSLVDLERNAQGEHQIQLLIKRQIGTDYHQIRIDREEFYIKPINAEHWLSEAEYMARHNQHYTIQRLVDVEAYRYLDEVARAVQKQELDEPLTQSEIDAIEFINTLGFIDRYYFETVRSYAQLQLQPHELFRLYREQRYRQGWYLPRGYFLPLGDNRDNSRDGRYYGVVAKDEVLGKARVRYWPLGRIGVVR